MSSLSLAAALSTMDTTMDSIRGVTALARGSSSSSSSSGGSSSRGTAYARSWSAELERRLASGGDPLPLVYSANDVLQETKRDAGTTATEFADALMGVMPALVGRVVAERPELRARVVRVLQLWKDRAVLAPGVLRVLFEKLGLFDLAADLPASTGASSSSLSASPAASPSDEAPQAASAESTTTTTNPAETERRKREQIKSRLESLSLERLLALARATVPRPDDANAALQAARTFEDNDLKATLAKLDTGRVSDAELAQTTRKLVQTLASLRPKRTAALAHSLICEAVVSSAEEHERRATEKMEQSSDSLAGCTAMERAIEALRGATTATPDQTVAVDVPVVRAIPKRQKVETLDKEALAAKEIAQRKEAEKSADVTMKWHPVLRMQVQMPDSTHEEDWRD